MNIETIEKNAFGHFRYLPKLLRFDVDDNKQLTAINCGLGTSMFNIVCDTHLEKWAKNQQDVFCFENGITMVVGLFMEKNSLSKKFMK